MRTSTLRRRALPTGVGVVTAVLLAGMAAEASPRNGGGTSATGAAQAREPVPSDVRRVRCQPPAAVRLSKT